MSKVADWVLENCSTVGTGALTLTGAWSPAYIRAQSVFVTNDVVEYTITDGSNREIGTGVFDGNNSIARTNVRATLFNGVYDNTSPAPISLSGSSIVACTLQAQVITDIWADIANRYTKTETSSIFNPLVADIADRYTKSEVDAFITPMEVDIADRYTKAESDALYTPMSHYLLGLSPGTILNAIREYTTPGSHTWTKPADFSHAVVVLTGAGASGASQTGGTANNTRSGTSGATCIKRFLPANVGASFSITIGAGGAGRTNTGGQYLGSLAGGASSISALSLTANGGKSTDAGEGYGRTRATATGGDINLLGGLASPFSDTPGADSIYPGSGGSPFTSVLPDAMNAIRGGGGGSINTSSTTTRTSGAGGDGVCLIFEYIRIQ